MQIDVAIPSLTCTFLRPILRSLTININLTQTSQHNCVSCTSLIFSQTLLCCNIQLLAHHHDQMLWALQAAGEPLPLRLPAVSRLVAIGDLHGDFGKTQRAFRLAGLIDGQDRWCGGTTTAVQASFCDPV